MNIHSLAIVLYRRNEKISNNSRKWDDISVYNISLDIYGSYISFTVKSCSGNTS